MIRRLPENEHTGHKQENIHDAGQQYPFEQTVLLDKAVCFSPGLNGNDDFFEQNGNLAGKYR
jgi:hypothetical protein